MEIKGRYLGWAIICLTLFVSIIFIDQDPKGMDQYFFLIVLTIFLGWCFLDNMEKSFIKTEPTEVQKR